MHFFAEMLRLRPDSQRLLQYGSEVSRFMTRTQELCAFTLHCLLS
jgi:hypothetical protein